MKDITQPVQFAISTNELWAISKFYSLVETIEGNGLKISYWENEENWASIIIDENTIGFIWKKYPLIIVISQYPDMKKIIKKHDYVQLIEVNNLSDRELMIDQHILNNEHYEKLNTEAFSAMDLWFYTNSL